MNLLRCISPTFAALADAGDRKVKGAKPPTPPINPTLAQIADDAAPAGDLPVVLKALNDMAALGDWAGVRKHALHVAHIAKNHLNEAKADEAGVVSHHR